MMKSNITCLRAVAFVFIAGLLGFEPSVYARAADLKSTHKFSIPPQSLDTALLAFSDQAKVQVLMQGGARADAQSSGAVGELISLDALKSILQDTGFGYQQIDRETVAIVPEGSQLSKTSMNASQLQPIRVAQSGPPSSPQDAGQQSPSSTENTRNSKNQSAASLPSEEGKEHESKLEEIVVTGTHIAGGPPIGSPLITISAADIADSGYSTIGDVIRSIPQSFGGGINPGVVGTTFINTSQNVAAASTVNLRGLGSDSTLTLIDGHRLAADGFTSSFDISAIPLAAIERVEILTDSASSVYGSDAVAGVANFILKRNYEGAETSAHFGAASGGGATEREVSQLFGTNWASGNAMLSYEFYDQGELLNSERSFSASANSPLTLLPSQNRNSVFASAHQSLSDNVSTYAEGLYSDRKTEIISNDATPSYSEVKTTLFGVASGLAIELEKGWKASIDATLSSGKDAGIGNDTSGGAPETTDYYYANRTASIEASTAGPLFDLPSGPVQVAVGAGYRSESFHTESASYLDGSGNYFNVSGLSARRHLNYEYGELRVPMVQPDSTRLGLERLELSVSGRHEDYSDFGTNTSPKLGILYTPWRDLGLRGSWGKAFRAPDLENEYGPRQVLAEPAFYFGTFPAGAQLLYQAGGNPTLQPETARSWTAGLDYKPDWVPTLRASLTYFNIDYRNRITTPIADFAAALTTPAYTPFVIRNPGAAFQAALLAVPNTTFHDYTGSVYDPEKVVALVENQYQNATAQQVHGLDFSGHYGWHESFGDLDISMNATWLTVAQMLTPTSPEEIISSTVFYSPRFRSRLGVTWQDRGWSAASFLNYVSRETDNTDSSLLVNVASWTTVDAQIRYDASNWGGFLRGMALTVASQNLFNRAPPELRATSTLPPSIGYDSTNASPLGRFVSATVRKDW